MTELNKFCFNKIPISGQKASGDSQRARDFRKSTKSRCSTLAQIQNPDSEEAHLSHFME